MNITTTVKNCEIRSDLQADDEAMMKAHFTGGVQEQMSHKTDYRFVL